MSDHDKKKDEAAEEKPAVKEEAPADKKEEAPADKKEEAPADKKDDVAAKGEDEEKPKKKSSATSDATPAAKAKSKAKEKPAEPEPKNEEKAAKAAHPAAPVAWNPAKPEHIPRGTAWPSAMALGIMFFAWGLVTSPVVIAIGFSLFAASLYGWVGEIRHEQ